MPEDEKTWKGDNRRKEHRRKHNPCNLLDEHDSLNEFTEYLIKRVSEHSSSNVEDMLKRLGLDEPENIERVKILLKVAPILDEVATDIEGKAYLKRKFLGLSKIAWAVLTIVGAIALFGTYAKETVIKWTSPTHVEQNKDRK